MNRRNHYSQVSFALLLFRLRSVDKNVCLFFRLEDFPDFRRVHRGLRRRKGLRRLRRRRRYRGQLQPQLEAKLARAWAI
jgi:hypothetical protein